MISSSPSCAPTLFNSHHAALAAGSGIGFACLITFANRETSVYLVAIAVGAVAGRVLSSCCKQLWKG